MVPEDPRANPYPPEREHRRGERFPVVVPVQVKWQKLGSLILCEDAQALEVNAYGAMLRMREHPPVGAAVELVNRVSNEVAQAKVVAIRHSKSDAVAVELAAPSETFWGVTFRLKKAAADLRTLEDCIKEGGADPRVLREFRDAVDYVRKTAWVVYEWQERQLEHKDASTVLSLLTAERVRRAIQLNNSITVDFDARELTSETPGVTELLGAVEQLGQRLKAFQRNTQERE